MPAVLLTLALLVFSAAAMKLTCAGGFAVGVFFNAFTAVILLVNLALKNRRYNASKQNDAL